MSKQNNWKNNAYGEQIRFILCSLLPIYSPIGEWTKHGNIDLAKGRNMIIYEEEKVEAVDK
jgi:hypothetical protein